MVPDDIRRLLKIKINLRPYFLFIKNSSGNEIPISNENNLRVSDLIKIEKKYDLYTKEFYFVKAIYLQVKPYNVVATYYNRKGYANLFYELSELEV